MTLPPPIIRQPIVLIDLPASTKPRRRTRGQTPRAPRSHLGRVGFRRPREHRNPPIKRVEGNLRPASKLKHVASSNIIVSIDQRRWSQMIHL